MNQIHPSANIDRRAQLADDVIVGPFVSIEGDVRVGNRCTFHSGARLVGPLTIGDGNIVHAHVVVGDVPQTRHFKGESGGVRIGNDNFIREGVTIHQAAEKDQQTIIGNRNFLMVNTLLEHNCQIGDDVMLANASKLGAYSQVDSRAIISGNCSIHHHCRVGKMTMVSFSSTHNRDLPPYTICAVSNCFAQLNLVGLRRSGMSPEAINAIRKMFRLLFRQPRGAAADRGEAEVLNAAIEELPPELLTFPEIKSFVEFLRTSKRGVARYAAWSDSINSTEEKSHVEDHSQPAVG